MQCSADWISIRLLFGAGAEETSVETRASKETKWASFFARLDAFKPFKPQEIGGKRIYVHRRHSGIPSTHKQRNRTAGHAQGFLDSRPCLSGAGGRFGSWRLA